MRVLSMLMILNNASDCDDHGIGDDDDDDGDDDDDDNGDDDGDDNYLTQ